jgi:1-acyl-sn-glycerol-3-phosphate acyltransferase
MLHAMTPLARELARLSADEMVSALGVQQRSPTLRHGLRLPFLALSRELGRTLATMDGDIRALGLPEAARRALAGFGVQLSMAGAVPPGGSCLVLANHPGAYDALALMAALGREDLLILAGDRVFLRALPRLKDHLVFVGDTPSSRASALRRALTCLRRGGALLHFPAGRIEPDAEFELAPDRLLAPWQPGVSSLLRAAERQGARVFVAGVRGVHSPRAKAWALNRLAERHGVTTLCPLLQLVGKLKDVTTNVRIEPAPPASGEPALRELLRGALARSAR